MKILGIDMGWSKSVSCVLDSETGEVAYQTIVTGKQPFARRLEQARCDLVVIEAGPMAGWVRDLCEQRNQKLLVLNTSDEPWQWQKVKKKTDRQDALKLCRIAMMNQGSQVHVPKQEVRQQRQLISYRDTLTSEMTSIKNRLRAVLLQEDIRLASGKKAWAGEDVDRSHPLRRRTPPPRPAQTRLMGHRPHAATHIATTLKTINSSGERHGAEKTEIELYKPENIFSSLVPFHAH